MILLLCSTLLYSALLYSTLQGILAARIQFMLLDSQHEFLPQELSVRKQGILAARIHAARTLPKVGYILAAEIHAARTLPKVDPAPAPKQTPAASAASG